MVELVVEFLPLFLLFFSNTTRVMTLKPNKTPPRSCTVYQLKILLCETFSKPEQIKAAFSYPAPEVLLPPPTCFRHLAAPTHLKSLNGSSSS